MRIGINARMFHDPKRTGISRSVEEILRVWAEKHPEHEYLLFTNRPVTFNFELPENWHIECSPWTVNKGILWERFELPNMLERSRPDVFWGTNFSLPPRTGGIRYYVTDYDLAAFRIPGTAGRKTMLWLRLTAKKSCRRADRVIAISEATAKDITELFGIEREKIAVSYCGGPKQYKFENNEETPRKEPGDFLFISTIEPRKNIGSIIRAYEKYAERNGTERKLVLAGQIGWRCEDILRAAKESRFAEHIVMPGYITEEEKDRLMSGAAAFIYPSLYEGFGLPVLEAFSYGLPVLTARVSSLPEVGGDAAFYIDDPRDDAALAQLMETVCSLKETQRAELIKKEKAQLSRFSWEKNAEELLQLFGGTES